MFLLGLPKGWTFLYNINGPGHVFGLRQGQQTEDEPPDPIQTTFILSRGGVKVDY